MSFSGTSGNHLVVVVDDDGCDGTGIGTLGSSFANGGMVTMTDNQTIFAVTAIHELGHNVSLEHANGPAGEYWDLYSVMGLAASYTFNGQPVVFTPSALDSARRDQLGFDVAGELEVVTEGQQVTRALAPRGSASGLRGLEVRRGGTSYWVEWRSGTARDDGAFYEGYSGSNFGATRYNPGVTVVTRPTGGNGSTELQSLTVGGTRFGARTSGQTFTDGDLTITVGAIGTTASVSVQNGTAPSPDLPSATPTVSGTPVVDGTFTAGTAGWESGSTFAYQWRVGGVDVAGATASTYSPRPADVGKTVTVRVTGSKTGFTSVTRESAATAAVAAGTLTASTPTVSGTPVVGGTLTVTTGAWGPTPVDLVRQWRVGGVDVDGETGATFSPRPEDVGKTVTVRVTGTKAGYTTASRESAATAAVAPGTLTAPTPTITGTASVGSTLTAVPGSWGPAPVTLAPQWRVGGVDVAGETGTTFDPRPADVGKTVTVRVTGSKSGYTSVSRESAPTAPVAAAPSRSWRAVSAGAASTCGITTTSALLCWGENGSGRLGDGTTTRRLVPTPVEGATTWKAVSVGGQHACAVSTTARLFCWGENGSGQLGLNSTTDRTTPTQVGTRADWASVSAGTSHTCATKTDGRLFCWGANGSGRVGDGTTTTRRSAVQVGTKADWANVSAGSEHTCAVKTTGARYCWGKNTSRQLGSGTTTATTPRAVGTGVSSTSVGSLHSCSIQRTYRLACWGANARGQVGRGTTSTYVATPVTIGTLTWRNVDGGGLHTCGVAGTGRLYCWGANTSSQLGHNGVTGRDEPGPVGTATDWASVSAGTSHSCAVTKDGRLFCWGANASGQLGRGDTVGRATPDQVP